MDLKIRRKREFGAFPDSKCFAVFGAWWVSIITLSGVVVVVVVVL